MANQRYPKVLISYFFGSNSIPLGLSCAKALESLGCEVLCFDSGIENRLHRFLFKPTNKFIRGLGFKKTEPFKKSPYNNSNFRQTLLEKAVIKFRPDILFILRGHGFDTEFLKYLKEEYKIKKLVGWWVKGPKWFDLMLSEAKEYDHYFCIHREGYTSRDKINYFPAIAVDKNLYRRLPTPNGIKFKQDIVFVGGWTAKRQKIMEKMIDFSIAIYGPKWRKKNIFNLKLIKKIKGRGIWGENLVRLYNTTKIALNISVWDSKRLSGLNLRVFDIPACGTFLISEYSDELREYFKIGQDIETFIEVDELNDKLSYFLKKDRERERIALNGYKRTLSLDTFENKMSSMLEKVYFKG